MGVFLIVDSGTGLITGERPPLGVVELGGHVIWSGWLMAVSYTHLTLPTILLV